MNLRPTLPSAAGLPWLLSVIALSAPMAIDGTLPTLSAIAGEFSVSDVVAQQTLTAFFVAFAAMMLVYGALADALGRRIVMIGAAVGFTLGSLACCLADSLEWLLAGRFVQGLTAGAGIVVGRAVLRDLFETDSARRIQSFVMVVFAMAPALAPILAGAAVQWGGWRAVFGLLAALGMVSALAVVFRLPETLAVGHRRSLRPTSLLHGYRAVFASRRFWLLTLTLSMLQSGAFVYLASAPRIIETHLGLASTEFAWLSLPLAAGTMMGALAGGQLAAHLRPHRQVWLAGAVLLVACTANLLLHATGSPGLPWVFIPPALFTVGVAVANPTLQMLMLEQFGDRAATASSCLAFVQALAMGVTSGVVAPLAYGSLSGIAGAQAALTLAGLLLWTAYRFTERRFRTGAP